jgi:molybdenum cofactor biosynthesis enzyme MoaA
MRCELVLSDACNFKCPYCRGQRKELRKHMTLAEAMNVIDLWTDEGLENVRFSGGEPTVWKGILELVQYTKSKGVSRIALSTNGSASWELYQQLIDAGVNDFSVSLDACCSAYGDKMAGVSGAWEVVVENIRKLTQQSYTTVGIVVTDETVHDLKNIVEYAASLGVNDIRIISAAQYNKILDVAQTISPEIYEKYPILKYRINNTMNGVNVRGIDDTDSKKCWIALDDMAVAGDYHYPCIIYLREQGNPIGKVGVNMRKEREEWVKNHNTHEDPICKKNCLECIVQYNRDYRDYHNAEK